MADMFTMDWTGMLRFKKLMKRSPKAARKAVAFTLTGFALGTTRNAKQVIESKFTLRNPKFILSSIKTVFARGNVPLSKMEAIAGSVVRPRYTGLREQELGTTPSRNRVFTSAARGGNFSSPAKGYARLKPNAKYPSPSNTSALTGAKSGRKDFNLTGLSGAKRIVAFLSILNERKVAQTFIIKRKFGRFGRGLYRFKQGVIKKLQSFDTRRRPKRIKWLTMGQKNYFKTVNIQRVWNKNILHELKKLL